MIDKNVIIVSLKDKIMAQTGIYKLEFSDGSFYVGQSVDIVRRARDHYRMLVSGSHHSYKVQNKYKELGTLPIHTVICTCNIEELGITEDKYIELTNPLCLNIKAGESSNFGANAITAKYSSEDIEIAFLILVENPGVLHRYVADFVGIDINTVHDISAGRNRVYTELQSKYPEKYAQLIKMKAHNTRGKNTIILEHTSGDNVTLVTGEYSDFCKKHGIQTSNLSKVINGKRNSTMGWKLIKAYENV